jgi:serine/threonine protein kinase
MHRDLKPANIMLTADHRVKLGDLGLSRYFTELTMEAFSKVGTPLYMSPEVLQGDGYGFAADVWSLGCILYELCTLRSPFKPPDGENTSLFALFGSIKGGKFAPISTDSWYSPTCRNFIHSMIALKPEHRPSIEQVTFPHPFGFIPFRVSPSFSYTSCADDH